MSILLFIIYCPNKGSAHEGPTLLLYTTFVPQPVALALFLGEVGHVFLRFYQNMKKGAPVFDIQNRLIQV